MIISYSYMTLVIYGLAHIASKQILTKIGILTCSPGSVIVPCDRPAGQAGLLVLHLRPLTRPHPPHGRLPDLQCGPQVLAGLPAPQQLPAEDLQSQVGGK